MFNQRFQRHFDTMMKNGWDVEAHDQGAIIDDNFAQLFVYWPQTKHTVMSVLSVDRFYQLVEEAQKNGGPDFHNSEILCNALCHFSVEHSKKRKGHESLIGLINACYMASTNTGKTYFNNAYGFPFSFIALLYPSNKKHTNFNVRPAISIGNKLMSVDEVHEMANTVMQHDKDVGKKEFFKYLKKR